jgi:hypothetical protein
MIDKSQNSRIHKSVYAQGTKEEDLLHFIDCEFLCGTDETCDCDERNIKNEIYGE